MVFRKYLKPLTIHIRKYLRHNNIPILLKLMMCFGFIFALMIVLSYTGFNNYKKDKESATFSAIKKANMQAISQIDDYINDLESITKMPLQRYDDNGTSFIQYLRVHNSTDTSDVEYQNFITRILSEAISYKKQIQSIFIYHLNGDGNYASNIGFVNPRYNPAGEAWFEEAIEKSGSQIVIGTHQSPNMPTWGGKNNYVFSTARAIMDISPRKALGIIVVNTRVDFLTSILKKMQIATGQRIIIVDPDKNIICDTKEEGISGKLEDKIFGVPDNSSAAPARISIDNVDYMVGRNISEKTGWAVINLIPFNELNKDINRMRNVTTIITLAFILIAFLLALAVSRQIIYPLKKLIILMKLVENGDFNVKVNIKNHDEIRTLSRSFNKMTFKIKTLINEVYLDKIKQNELEIQMLQNQINPHFLYNTLESISMNAEINNDESTSDMAYTLGKILRYSISRNKVNVTIREEISHLEDYIRLLEPRFEGMFETVINIDSDIYDNVIIKLVLQPLVENAIYHGMSTIGSGGLIKVTGCRNGQDIILEVSDNGKGMDREEVRKINDYISGLNDSFRSIGLKNVNKRIQLYYGGNYGIVLESTPDIGTRVKVTIPCV